MHSPAQLLFLLYKQQYRCWMLGVGLLLISATVTSQPAQLMIPVGHTSYITSAGFSPDGNSILSGSWDNTAKLWEANSGLLIRDMKAHTASILQSHFSGDGKYIVTVSKDSTLCLWNTNTGLLLWRSQAHSDWVTEAVFTLDNRFILSGTADGGLYKWEVATGRLVQQYADHHQWISAVGVSENRKWWITGSWDSTVTIRTISTDSLLFSKKIMEGRIRFAFFTGHDQYLVAGNDRNQVYIWSMANQQLKKVIRLSGGELRVLKQNNKQDGLLAGTSLGEVYLIDTKTGDIKKQWQAHKGFVNDLVLSEDQQLLISSGSDSTTIVWDWKAGKKLRQLEISKGETQLLAIRPQTKNILSASDDNALRISDLETGKTKVVLKGHCFFVNTIQYDKSGSRMVTASNDNTARIWSAEGPLKQTLSGHTDWVNNALFSDDGKYVLTASNDRTAKLWLVSDGSVATTFRGHEDWVNTAVFNPGGNLVLTSSSDHTARIWQRSNGQELFKLEGHTDWVTSAAFSPDGKRILTASIDNTARVWETATGKQLIQLGGDTDSIRLAIFSPDGQYIATASKDYSIRIWKATDGSLQYSWKGHTAWINKMLFSEDGKRLASLSQDNTIRVWNLVSGKPDYLLEGHTAGISDAAFSKNGQQLVSASWDHTARVWDLKSGSLQWVLKGHTDIINSLSISPDEKYLLTSSEDNTIRKWSLASGELLYSFFSVDSNDYLAYDTKGRFDGTPAARKLLYYVCGNEIVDFEQIKELAWEPGLAAKLSGLSKEPVTALATEELQLCNYSPVVQSAGLINGVYHFNIQPRTGGLQQVQLYVNTKMVGTYPVTALAKKGDHYSLAVPVIKVNPYFIPGEENTVTIKASAGNGAMYSRGAIISVRDNKKRANPNMYIVSIGISRYKEDKMQLKFASKDSRELGAALAGSGRKLLNTDSKQHVTHYILNTDTVSKFWPTKKNIQRVIDTITRKAQPEDVVVLFFAGHGMLYNTGKSFYLLTADAGGFDIEGVEQRVAISAEELNQWMSGIRANKQVLILDACNSGKVIQQVKEVMGKREVPADQQRALERLKDKTGTFILSAAASDQSAYETGLYRQGLLTYSLLTGLKLGQGLKDNKFIDVNRWFNFAADNVKILAKDIGGRQDPQIIGNGSFDLGLVDQEVSDGIHLSIRRKLFRESRFIQDDQLLNDDLEIADLFDRELDNLSLSGKESPIIFVSGNKLADAYSVRGKYEVKNGQVKLQAWVVKGTSEKVFSLEGEEKVENKDALIISLVNQIKTFFDTHN